MSSLLLAKPKLPHDFIDVSVGEAYVVRETLDKVFPLFPYELSETKNIFEYPDSKGYAPLVKLLEDKHKAPVIITNGAKQGLSATLNLLKKLGKQKIGLPNPCWCLLPPLIEHHGLTPLSSYEDADANLFVGPNNPDGYMPTLKECKDFAQDCKDKSIPFIHDSVYYNHIYLPTSYSLDPIGDLQIFSFSKSFGLSGCRLGYIVCHNKDYYNFILEYIEMSTVGCSIVSQMFLHDLLHRMHGYPTLVEAFEGKASMALSESRKIIKQVNPEILEVNPDIENIPGMFGFFKVGPKADFIKSKVNFIDGALFGQPGYVRMNLAFNKDIMEDIVKRLNGVLDA